MAVHWKVYQALYQRLDTLVAAHAALTADRSLPPAWAARLHPLLAAMTPLVDQLADVQADFGEALRTEALPPPEG